MSRGGRIRVVHLAQQLTLGGMEKLLVEFARHGDREHFEPVFVSMTGRGLVAEEIEECGWSVYCLEGRPGRNPGLVLDLARLFRRLRADVVHTHNTGPMIYGSVAARLARVPVVVHTRHGQRHRAGRMETRVFRVLSHLVDRVVCVSRDSARLSQVEGISRHKVHTIWNGIDLDRFAYSGPMGEGPAVSIARLSPEKDFATLIRAVARLIPECPGFQLEIAGDGPCMTDLKSLSAELGLGSHVRFLGEVRDIPAVLRRASMFLLPSLTEGVSLTLLEAMARGLPVIATAVGGNPEVVSEGETGLLVPSGSPDALANAIRTLVRDPIQGRRMGSAGRERVELYFNVRRMVSDYETLYLSLGARSRGPRPTLASLGPQVGEPSRPIELAGASVLRN